MQGLLWSCLIAGACLTMVLFREFRKRDLDRWLVPYLPKLSIAAVRGVVLPSTFSCASPIISNPAAGELRQSRLENVSIAGSGTILACSEVSGTATVDLHVTPFSIRLSSTTRSISTLWRSFAGTGSVKLKCIFITRAMPGTTP